MTWGDLGRYALESADRRRPVDDGGKICQVDPIGDDVAPGDDVVRHRIPDQVWIVRGLHRLKRRVAGFRTGKIVGLAVKRRQP